MLIALAYVLPVQATSVKPIDIHVLTDLAAVVVNGEIVAMKTEDDPYESGRMVTYYTIKVNDWIKGDPQNGENEIVIKQLADGEYMNEDGIRVRQRLYIPKYELNKKYVFFLPNAHSETGLLAPIGLWQGVFNVETDSSGKQTLPQLKNPMRAKILKGDINTKNKSQYLSLDINASEGQDTSYESFKTMVKGLAEE